MCAVMVFAVVDKADTIVMNHEEELDSWSVIINGAVRVEGNRNYYIDRSKAGWNGIYWTVHYNST